MRLKFLSIGLGLILLHGGSVFSYESRDLPGIDLITREERGADESRKRADSGFYDRYIKRNDMYSQRERGEMVDENGVFAARQTRDQVQSKQRSFMIDNFPNDIATDETYEEEDGHDLRRAIETKEDKTKIVIHHTASSQNQESIAKVYSGLQYIYKLHAHTNGRGDVGYNFFIDTFGNIYEGRAGGRGAVGAHASRNNVSTVGIALLGNYDVTEPSAAMMESLTRLTTMLALEYNIRPSEQQSYFTESSKEPFLVAHVHDSIVGHRDTKSTACPGKYVYDKLPQLKETVEQYLDYVQREKEENEEEVEFLAIPETVYLEGDRGMFSVNVKERDEDVACRSFDETVEIRDCRMENGWLSVYVDRGGYPASGPFTFGVHGDEVTYFVEVSLIREDDLQDLAGEKRSAYLASHALPSPSKASEKMQDTIDIDEVEALMDDSVKVLLYELTAEYDRWDVRCEGSCRISLDDEELSTKIDEVSIVEDKATDMLMVSLDGDMYEGVDLSIESNAGLLEVVNYPRGANGLAYNVFRGDLRIHKDSYNHLEYGRLDRYVVVNEVEFEDYLHGIAETSELQHDEKLKTIAILVKNYALFYLKGTNPHPSIPVGASYNAVDDPRIFQKYVGAGFESYGKRRHDALRQTKNLVVMYDDYLPILPYFHCSAGFTRSGKENRGRTDTPRLQSKLDFMTCESGDFEGHGVGLSGDGAQRLAEKGATFEEILMWYYEGVEIEEIKN